jgi:hypothetical protein
MDQLTQGLVGKPEENRLHERSRCRWGVNTKMDLREVIWVVSDRYDLLQDRKSWRALVNAVINLRVP